MARRITRTGRNLEDSFFKEAKRAGYVSRAAFKLLSIQEKHRVITPGSNVLDLGCHPGAWLQVACQALGPRAKGGHVLGVDLQATQLPPRFCDDRVQIVQADARSAAFQALLRQLFPDGFSTVLSDMCHFTHGNTVVDAYRSLELARTAWHIATGGGAAPELAEAASAATAAAAEDVAAPDWGRGVLRPGGSLVMKLLQGPGTQEFAADLRQDFAKVAWHRPPATRSESKEVFLLGLKRK